MANPANNPTGFVRVGRQVKADTAHLKKMLLDKRRELSRYPSPEMFVRMRRGVHAKRFGPTALREKLTRAQTKEIQPFITKDLVNLAMHFAMFIENILEAVRRIYQEEMHMESTTIPGIITAKMAPHIDHLHKQGKRIDKKLTSHLKYWRWIIKKKRLPIFSRFNSMHPARFIDRIIHEEKEYRKELWEVVSALSAAYTYSTDLRKR